MRKIDLTNFTLATSETARQINRRIALNFIRLHQPMSRADLARQSGLQRSTVSAIVDQLMPNYAEAQQVKPDDARLKTSRETVPSPAGNGTIKGYLVRPASAGTNKLPAILVVHENRGLNPHIEDVARRMAGRHLCA